MTLRTTWNDYLDALLGEMPVLAKLVAAQVRERVLGALGHRGQGGPRQHLLALAHILRVESTAFAEALAGALRQQVQDGLQDAAPEPRSRPAAGQPAQLSLVDDQQLERDIELARVIQLIESAAEWELRELQAVCATLKRARSIRPEHNPLRPEMAARALLVALEESGLGIEARVSALRMCGAVLAEALRELYARHCHGLRRLGVPAQSYDAPKPAPAAPGPNSDLALRGLVARMAGRAAAHDTAARGDTLPGQLIPNLLTQIADQADMNTTMRGLLVRLCAPAVRTAEAEAGVLLSLEHPVWRLIDRVASLSSVSDDGGSDGGLVTLARLLEPIVSALEKAERPGTDIFEEALDRVGEVTVQLNSARLSTVARLDIDLTQPTQNLELNPTEPGVTRRPREIDATLRRRVAAQLRHSSAPPTLRQFLLGPWVVVMAHAIAQHGAASDQAVRWQDAVDDFIRQGDEVATARAHTPDPTALLALAAQGMESAQIPLHQRQASLAELRDALVLEPLPADMPAAGGGDHQPATIPMDMVDTDANSPAKQNREAWLAELAPGDLCRMFLQGRWMNAQLTWRSTTGQFCVFANRHGGHLHSLT
ncbi:MAG: DUF1631 family protein, partial [Burkholderiales bacterium]